MKFSVNHLGPIQHADIEAGDLTIICGRNNNGKTYLTYTLGTFFNTIKYNVVVPVDNSTINELLDHGEVVIDLNKYIDCFIKSVDKTIPHFTKSLPQFLAMHPDRFLQTSIKVDIPQTEILSCLDDKNLFTIHSEIKVSDKLSLFIDLKQDEPHSVVITMLNKSDKLPSKNVVERLLAFLIARMFDDRPRRALFPKTFVITCERTGTILFRQELINLRNKNDDNYPVKIVDKPSTQEVRYQRPVEKEIDFVLNLDAIQNSKSVIAKKYPKILKMLMEITGGEYKFETKTNQVRFVPSGSTSGSLTLPESSSTVRSLAELYFYLKHQAAPGQLLIFDEPELNLHPANQRYLARLLASLVNAGIKVFITTHSDYILREFNALIRLNNIAKRKRAELLKKFDIAQDSILNAKKVKLYMLSDGKTVEIHFDPDLKAFGVPSFDNTIEQFNELYTAVRNLDA